MDRSEDLLIRPVLHQPISQAKATSPERGCTHHLYPITPYNVDRPPRRPPHLPHVMTDWSAKRPSIRYESGSQFQMATRTAPIPRKIAMKTLAIA